MLLSAHHLGDYKGFRSSVPGMRGREKIYVLCYLTVYMSTMTESGRDGEYVSAHVHVCLHVCVYRLLYKT